MDDTVVSSPLLLTPRALCAQLSISYRTYSRLVLAGMPAVFVLTARRYDLAEVLAWLRVRSVPSVPAPTRRVRAWTPNDDQTVRHLKMLVRGNRR